MSWLVRQYARRVINVNVNIVIAGIMALGITVVVMSLLTRMGLENKYAITGLTFLVDLVADVLVYYGLHWFANHMPIGLPKRITPAYANLSFLRDATLVQFERAILSPVLYTIALGLQHTLLQMGWGVEAATAIGFGVGIASARSLHTMWMVRQERRAIHRQKAQAAAEPAGVAEPVPESLRRGA